MATINAAGEKLPIRVLAKGKTEKCENKFRKNKRLRKFIKNNELIVYHSKTGWASSEVMKKYLKWLSKMNNGNSIYLLFDLHASHRNNETKFHAQYNDVNLSYIPAGQTGFCQPLDKRIFGNLKKKSQKEFELLLLDKEFSEVDLIDALVILLKTWKNIPKKSIIGSWSHLIADSSEEYEYQQEEEEEEPINLEKNSSNDENSDSDDDDSSDSEESDLDQYEYDNSSESESTNSQFSSD
ncbi:hypothetical protein TRFO_40949 [Tritrichomonas foetus]|uniref:DDE-1 domain-containing protein n=1 Tax=Tritrichomonas foetus TaxID=1144522 RepID=A0A1J4IZ80_9EUKA|nr:hypothetical protein TRFO_40949 [Tritrichomonas foetus]|eukprot:OHS92718.1 hypothetical protein TRFO_40949 [Tritrichomonas foetus]